MKDPLAAAFPPRSGVFKLGGVSGLTLDEVLATAGWQDRPQNRALPRSELRAEAEAVENLIKIVDKGETAVLKGELIDQRLKAGLTNYNNVGCSRMLTRIAGLTEKLPFLLEIKDAKGQPILTTDLEKDAAMKILELMEKLPDDERHKLLEDLKVQYAAARKANRAARKATEREVEQLRRLEAALLDVREWEKRPLKLERQTSSQLHKFLDAITEERILALKDEDMGYLSDETRASIVGFSRKASVFVVQHDWAAAFASITSDQIEKASVRLPDTHCIFEFRISGKTVIALVEDEKVPGGIAAPLSISTGETFLCNYGLEDGPEVYKLVDRAVLAIAIALDADVAGTETVEAPVKLNRARVKLNRAPLVSYHVVKLARQRDRVVPLARDPDEPPSHRKRWHFRRGHWAHFGVAGFCPKGDGSNEFAPHRWQAEPMPESKTHRRQAQRNFCACGSWRTWRNWTLAGDPDLGWIEKEYRL